MKLHCSCGNVMADNSDMLSYKAHFIADRDYDDRDDSNQGLLLERTMYQCWECGRLWVDDQDNNPRCFEPASPDTPKDILNSTLKDKWKRPVSARWFSDANGTERGELWWQGPPDDSGFEDYVDWDALERRYYELVERIQAEDTLRYAWLRKDGETIHQIGLNQ